MDLSNKTDLEILKVANPIMDNLMDASTSGDFERHVRDFSERIKENFTKEEFQNQCEEYRSKWGVFTDREFIGATTTNKFANIYWKQRFSETDDEYLAVLTLSQKDGQYIVERAFVDLWQLES
jgi:hypothetical protein